jgi:lipid-A-disaccharide synthase-like uncharacterized protein
MIISVEYFGVHLCDNGAELYNLIYNLIYKYIYNQFYIYIYTFIHVYTHLYIFVYICTYLLTMNKNSEELRIIPYTATSLSVVGRFIFMFLLYKNKSTNILSLTFCILSIFSSGMWIYYSVQSNDTPMIVRSSVEISLLTLSAIYIIRNKVRQYYESLRILPS